MEQKNTWETYDTKQLEEVEAFAREYMDFLENAAVKRGWPEQIDKILVEELAPYFNGDREAEDAVANIQNRVQLYLYEKE